jgi:bacterial/archaeal transporter family protein
MDFRIWAVLSAVFAGATAILVKKGVTEVPTTAAMAVRVAIIFVISVIGAYALKERITGIAASAWGFLAASAMTTGLSWWCYFQALRGGPVSVVAPIDKLSFVIAVALGALMLGESISVKVGIGVVLIVAGVLVTLS